MRETKTSWDGNSKVERAASSRPASFTARVHGPHRRFSLSCDLASMAAS